ncbi:hypothetical protein DNL40_06090 [Xylanimonas oleitrophica]|uniref:Phospholipase/carboxylesterase/thioesterase domain-containing protein n=1 Tax=Xylanimonas oleitrophica TaxID=2607479 RepID=A0A2W5XU34_9MICO|nr:PHB depolymerase family esterase [Xylanimonas oleitrophica]PZR53698.1 hypothetical protein DNL40_06090 [Xylanimonas oleitrophica]
MSSSIEVDGRHRTYTVVGEHEGPAGRPLVLVFHGSRQTGRVFRRFTGGAFDALAGTAVVAYLDGYRGNWNDARRESSFPARTEGVDDVAFTRAVVRELAASHGVDPGRVHAVGYSNGGQMVLRLLHETPGLLAGAVVVGATLPAPGSLLLPSPAPAPVPLPVLVVHGTGDRVVPYGGGPVPGWVRLLFKVGGANLSAAQTAEHLARRNGITRPPRSRRLAAPAHPARTRAGRRTRPWVEQTDHVETGRPPVRLLTVHGGGHTVPGPGRPPFVLGRTTRDVSVAEVAAELFDLTPRE